MKNKLIPIIVIAAVVVGSGAFYGGMKYAKNKTANGFNQTDFQNLRNLSPAERQQRLQQFGADAGGSRDSRLPNGQTRGQKSGFTAGEIISKDENSVTIKLPEGGSKIIFYSDATEVGKLASASLNDLEVGKNIMVAGAANADGSVTAQSIQLRFQQ